MRIGLSGGGATVDRIIDQAVRAERDGFTSMWYPGAVGGDPLIPIALAARATTTLELGTSIVQTYPCHPVLQASRAAAVASAIGEPRFTLGIGPSHRPVIESYGLSYAHPGRHTEEYVKILTTLLRGESVDFQGEDFRVRTAARTAGEIPVPVLIAALGPRLLRVAGQQADGTILWMTNARAVESHVAPRLRAAARTAGRPEPRIVAGVPIAVHDNSDEAQQTISQQFAGYGRLPNYRRILDIGAAEGPADAAIFGDEKAVTRQVEDLFAAGVTDLWAAIVPVGEDRQESRARTRALLKQLATST